jgi:hypothetical protein
VEEHHPPRCLHRANSDEQELQGVVVVVVVVAAAADLVCQRPEEAHRQVKAAVGDGSDSFQLPGRANTTRRPRMNVAGPVEASSEINSERVPGTEVLKRSYATQRKSAAENENLFRGT